MNDTQGERERREQPLHIFYSYAREDEGLCRELEKHLSALRWQGKIVDWSSREILPGMDWATIVHEKLLAASLIFLLVSPDFLNSPYCYGKEMQQALKRAESGDAAVIPILLRSVDLEGTPLARLQCLPRNGKPVTLWQDRDEAFQQVATEIRLTIEHIDATGPGRGERAAPLDPEKRRSGKASGAQRLLYKYDVHADKVFTVAWSPDGTRIASGGLDNTVHVWQAATGRHLLTYRHPKKLLAALAIYVVRWSPDSQLLASAGVNSSNVYVWKATDGQTLTIYNGHIPILPAIYSLAWSPDGRYIASANLVPFEALAHIWDAASGDTYLKINMIPSLKETTSGVVAWASDGTRLAAKWGKHVHIRNAHDGKNIFTFNGHNDWILDIAWSPDLQYIVSAQRERILVWNVSSGNILCSYERHVAPIQALAISPNGQYVASVGKDWAVHIWELETGRQRLLYKEHRDQVNAVTWSPDGEMIASASSDSSVHVWRTLLE